MANRGVTKVVVVFALKEVVDNKGVGLSQMTVQKLIASQREACGTSFLTKVGISQEPAETAVTGDWGGSQ